MPILLSIRLHYSITTCMIMCMGGIYSGIVGQKWQVTVDKVTILPGDHSGLSRDD